MFFSKRSVFLENYLSGLFIHSKRSSYLWKTIVPHMSTKFSKLDSLKLKHGFKDCHVYIKVQRLKGMKCSDVLTELPHNGEESACTVPFIKCLHRTTNGNPIAQPVWIRIQSLQQGIETKYTFLPLTYVKYLFRGILKNFSISSQWKVFARKPYMMPISLPRRFVSENIAI